MARRPPSYSARGEGGGAEGRLASARAYNKDLLRELPRPLVALGELGALPAARAALVEIFRSVCKESRLELSGFPLRGASQLLRALGRDFTAQLRRVLDEQLLRATHVDCADAHRNCELLFRAWADGARDFEGIVKERLKRQRSEPPLAGQADLSRLSLQDLVPPPAHVGLEERLSEVVGFRNAHDQLRDVLVKVLTAAKARSRRRRRSASCARRTSKCATRGRSDERGGRGGVDAARRRYDGRIGRLEADLAAALRERLAGCRSASEMFRVCATFNPLFWRPRIRETVAEFQERLIEVVRRDLDTLTERFKTSGAARAQAALLSRLRGVADVASTVRWARQLEGRLNAHMSNLQAVLGGREACADHAEGQRLLHAAEAFRAKLSSRALLEEWRREANASRTT